jgi:VanZ family protein
MIRRNIFSVLVACLIAYLSLSESDSFDKVSFFNFPGADKLVHFGMYFMLMSVIVFEHRKNIGRINVLLLTGLIPLFYGVLMEVLQKLATSTRTASFGDIIFDFAGVLFSVIIFLIFRPLRNLIIR